MQEGRDLGFGEAVKNEKAMWCTSCFVESCKDASLMKVMQYGLLTKLV